MKAAIYYGPGQISLKEIEKPVIREDEYLVQVISTGICGTDIKTYKQGHRMFTPPCVLGHEFSGTIVEAGKDVDQSLVGKKITCAPYVGCGYCYNCRKGLEELCFNKIGTSGAFTQFLVISKELADKGMWVLSDDADAAEMAMAEPLACILNSVRKSGVKYGQNALVIGAGPMGLIHVSVLKMMGVSSIIVSEMNENRRTIAEKMGAVSVDPVKEDVSEFIKRTTSGAGVDHIFICVGVPAVVEEAMNYTSSGTVINIFGGLKSGSQITIDPNVIHYNAVSIVGSFGFTADDFKNAARLLENGQIRLSNMITHRYSINEITEAFKNSLNPEVVKSIVLMNKE